MSKKNIVIWGAWYGSRNVGDQLLLLAITDLLNNQLEQTLRFSVLTNDAKWVNEYTSKESSCQIKAIQSRQAIIEVIKELKNCDLFIFGGGVPFFDKPSQLFVMSFLTSVVRFFHKPYLLWSVSSQRIQSKLALTVFRWIVNGTQWITYRDKNTQALFEACGVNPETMRQVPDAGFTLGIDEEAKSLEILKRAGWQPNGRPLVALTPRKLRTADGEAETHYKLQSIQQYQKKLACFTAAYDWLWENGFQPIFIPMNTVNPDNDLLAARDIVAQAKYGKHALFIDEVLRPRTVPGLYKQCHASFVARVHGSITSLLGNCPMMMYAFAPKHKGIMEMMGMANYIIEEDNATPQHTIKTLKTLVNNHKGLQKRMQIQLIELQKDALFPGKLAKQIFEN